MRPPPVSTFIHNIRELVSTFIKILENLFGPVSFVEVYICTGTLASGEHSQALTRRREAESVQNVV